MSIKTLKSDNNLSYKDKELLFRGAIELAGLMLNKGIISTAEVTKLEKWYPYLLGLSYRMAVDCGLIKENVNDYQETDKIPETTEASEIGYVKIK